MKLWKRILFISLTFLVLYFVYKNRSQLFQVYNVISGGILRWLALAIILEIVAYYFLIRAHQFGLQAVNIKRTPKELLPLVLGSLVLNTTAPTAGATGALLFADDAAKRNESPFSAATGILLLIVSYFFGLLGILFVVLIYLQTRGELGLTEVIFTLILVLVTIGYTLAIYLAEKKPVILRHIFSFLNDNFNRIFRLFRIKSTDAWIKSIIGELANAAKTTRENPRKIAEIILMQFATHLANVMCLFFIFLAFGEITKFGIIITGYAIGELFRNASPAPEGVGVTEGSMAIIYTSFGIDPIDSAAIAIAYRGLNFWIPFGIGFAMLQAKHLLPKRDKKS